MRPSPYLIAEMACSHDGDEHLARIIIDAAIEANADAIQLQIWSPDNFVVPGHSSRPVLDRIGLDRETWRSLINYIRARAPSIDILACVYSVPAVEFCEEAGVTAYKIHAGDLTNPFLLRAAARTGKRIDLSVGASSYEEIVRGLGWLEDEDCRDVWLMYGYQSFPTPVEAINLARLRTLSEVFELPVGYQDHSDADLPTAFWLPAQAYGLGINIFEKHLTHDRSRKGVDHEAALNPDEFQQFSEMLRTLHSAHGSGVPRRFSEQEEAYRVNARKSLVYRHQLSGGHVLREEDVVPMRTEEPGTAPDRYDHFLGRKLNRDVDPFEHVSEDQYK